MSHHLTFILAGDPNQLTGGYLYDARMVEALREQGWSVEVIGLAGRFPEPDATAAQSMEDALARQPEGAKIVIDGLALGGLPEVIAKHSKRLELTALVHHPLADETDLDQAQRTRFTLSETRSLTAVNRIIATSAFTARRLADFNVEAARIAVIEPGVEPAPLAEYENDSAATGQHLLCVATLIPRKGQDVLIDALARLNEYDWRCDLIGSPDRDPRFAEKIAHLIREHGLEDRICLHGEQSEEALGQAYHEADLFVLPSFYEGYGMVISEALARGLPVITTTGGALAHTLPDAAGLSVPPRDSQALTQALKRWFDEPDLRKYLYLGAGKPGKILPTGKPPAPLSPRHC
ncbi:glycosyltransferase family 4 protein [Halomonas sp. PR-M31]|uniref:glycosyltransferase family 4 protein n=1 Tax=Halomonas sp. PR-M31 TaxID=1471202 RepID=UPI000A67FF61|nr:glycosyltransferase family 4 protein [Halomonas sp. PR-M31]